MTSKSRASTSAGSSACWTTRTAPPGELAWRTHVLSARTTDTELAPKDGDEIADARWGTLDELAGRVDARLLETGHALWRYRVALHAAALAALRATPA